MDDNATLICMEASKMQLAKNAEVYPLLHNLMKMADKTVFMTEPFKLSPYYQYHTICDPPSPRITPLTHTT